MAPKVERWNGLQLQWGLKVREVRDSRTPLTLALTSSLADNERNMKSPSVTTSPPAKATFWGVFLSTFITIFLAELGDKTQVATLLMSAESHKPLTVFIGAALALISTSLVGVLVGQWLARRVSPDTLDTLAGILLLLISVGLVADVIGL